MISPQKAEARGMQFFPKNKNDCLKSQSKISLRIFFLVR